MLLYYNNPFPYCVSSILMWFVSVQWGVFSLCIYRCCTMQLTCLHVRDVDYNHNGLTKLLLSFSEEITS